MYRQQCSQLNRLLIILLSIAILFYFLTPNVVNVLLGVQVRIHFCLQFSLSYVSTLFIT